MKLLQPVCLTACLLGVVLPNIAHAAVYEATLLHPTTLIGTSAYGISGTSQVGTAYDESFNYASHALLWNGTADSWIDLNPAGYDSSWGYGVSGTSQVGYLGDYTVAHAALWHGTAASAVDLHPAGYERSEAYAVAGSTQVGMGIGPNTGYQYRALLWNGTADSVVSLHPAGYFWTEAFGVSGNSQVGYGIGNLPSGNNSAHALLWSGTATSVVDLHPSGFEASEAHAVSGNSQVGYGNGPLTGGANHAVLWHGSAASAIDLNPSGFYWSKATGASDDIQVGYGASPVGTEHALVWRGDAESVVDLHSAAMQLDILDQWAGYPIHSVATGVDAATGDVVGYVMDDDSHFSYAVKWSPVAEPGIPGDYNNNGAVDAGDYAAWRKGNTTLHNEVATIGSNTPQDYTEWRARFGNNTGSSTSLNRITVPEPSSFALFILLSFALQIQRHADRSPQRKQAN